MTPEGDYSYNRWRLHARSAGSRSLSASIAFDGGGYFQGDRQGVQASFDWRPNQHLAFGASLNYDYYDFPAGTAHTRVVTFDNEVVFSSAMSLVSLIQWDNLSNELGVNTRFRWEIAPGQDIWLVLNHNMIDLDDDLRFTDSQTDIAFKIRYTLRY